MKDRVCIEARGMPRSPSDLETLLLERRLRALVSLLAVYCVVLVVVWALADGPDIGCVLAALFGHVCFVVIRCFRLGRLA